MTSPSSHNLPDQDSWLNRNLYDLNQLTDFARGVLSDSNSDGILDTVASPSRTQAWDLDAMGNWQSLSTNGTGQSRTHNARNESTGEGSKFHPNNFENKIARKSRMSPRLFVPTSVRHRGCISLKRMNWENEPEASVTEMLMQVEPVRLIEIVIRSESTDGERFLRIRFTMKSFRLSRFRLVFDTSHAMCVP